MSSNVRNLRGRVWHVELVDSSQDGVSRAAAALKERLNDRQHAVESIVLAGSKIELAWRKECSYNSAHCWILRGLAPLRIGSFALSAQESASRASASVVSFSQADPTRHSVRPLRRVWHKSPPTSGASGGASIPPRLAEAGAACGGTGVIASGDAQGHSAQTHLACRSGRVECVSTAMKSVAPTKAVVGAMSGSLLKRPAASVTRTAKRSRSGGTPDSDGGLPGEEGEGEDGKLFGGGAESRLSVVKVEVQPPAVAAPPHRSRTPASSAPSLGADAPMWPPISASDTRRGTSLILKAFYCRDELSAHGHAVSFYNPEGRRLAGAPRCFAWAKHTRSGAVVVLRTFGDRGGPNSGWEAFLKELFLNCTLQHSGIWRAMDIDLAPAPCIVYENGGSTLKHLLSESRHPFPSAKLVLRQLLDVVSFLHGRGVCHGEIRPQVVLVSPMGDVCLASFGQGVYCDAGVPPVTSPSQQELPGVSYRPPEEILDGGLTRAGDAWAIGCVFGEMLSGRVLFRAESEWNQVYKMHRLLGDPEYLEMLDLKDDGDDESPAIDVPEDCTTLNDLEQVTHPLGLALLQGLLRFHSGERWTPATALLSEFFRVEA